MADNIYLKDISSGQIYNEPIDSAQQLISQGTHVPASNEEVKNISLQQTFGTPLHQAGAFAQGAAETATLGGSSALLGAVAPQLKEPARLEQQVNPISHAAGGMAGLFIDPLLGSESIIGKALPLSKVEEAAAGVKSAIDPFAAKAAESLVSKTKSPFINKLLSDLPGSAARGSLIGGAFGAGQEIGEESLGDTSLNGEKIFSSATNGALFGGLLDGGLKAAEVGTIGLAEKASNLLKDTVGSDTAFNAYAKMAGKFSGTSEAEILAMRELQREAQSGLDKFKSPESFDNVSSQLETVLGDPSDASKFQTGQRLQNNVKSLTEETQQKFNDAYEPLREKYAQVPLPEGFTQSIIDNAGQDLVKNSESYKLLDQYKDAILESKTADDLKNVATAIRETIRKDTKFGAGYGSDLISAIKDTETNSVLASAKASGDIESVNNATALVSSLKSLDSKYAGHFDDFQNLSTSLGLGKYKGFTKFIDKLDSVEPTKLINALSKPDNINALRFFKQELPDAFNDFARYKKAEIRQAATTMDGFNPKKALNTIFDEKKFPKEIRQLIYSPDELSALESAQKEFKNVRDEQIAARIKNRASKDFLDKAKESNQGAIVGGLLGSTIGHGAAGAGIGKLYDIISNPAKTVKTLVQIETIVNSISKKISDGAKSIFELAPNKVKVVEAGLVLKDKKEQHDKLTKNLQAWSNNPEKMVDYLSKATSKISQEAPLTSQALQATAIKAVGYLHSKIPVVPDQKPLSQKMQISNYDTDKFIKIYDTVKNPFSVYENINNGTLTNDHIDVLKNVYPNLYQDMKVKAYDELIKFDKNKEKDKFPSYKKLGLGLFLQEDIVNSLNQQSIANNIANWSNPNLETENKDQAPVTKSNRSRIDKIKIANYTATETSKIENRKSV